MSFEAFPHYPPVDVELVDRIVCKLKSQGIFDQFRKDCLADVDTKPAYQNLQQRVNGTVATFLATQSWQQDLNKTQLRESLRRHVQQGFLEVGVDRIVDQVVNPKVYTVFMPKVEDVVYDCLGIEKPKHPPPSNNTLTRSKLTLLDLLPQGLDPVSPDSSFDGNDDTKDETNNNESLSKMDMSNDSQVSGISDLSSHMGDSFKEQQENHADSNTVKSAASTKENSSDLHFENFENLSEKIKQAEIGHNSITSSQPDLQDELELTTTLDVEQNSTPKDNKEEMSMEIDSVSSSAFEDSKIFTDKILKEDTCSKILSEESLSSSSFSLKPKKESTKSIIIENCTNSLNEVDTPCKELSSDKEVKVDTVNDEIKNNIEQNASENKEQKKIEEIKDRKHRDSSSSSSKTSKSSSDKQKPNESKHRFSNDRKDDLKPSKEKGTRDEDKGNKQKDEHYYSSKDKYKDKNRNPDRIREKDCDKKKDKTDPKDISEKDKKCDKEEEKDIKDKENHRQDKEKERHDIDKDRQEKEKHDKDKDRHEKNKDRQERERHDKDKDRQEKEKDRHDKEKHEKSKREKEKKDKDKYENRDKERDRNEKDKGSRDKERGKSEKDNKNGREKECSRPIDYKDDKKKDSRKYDKSVALSKKDESYRCDTNEKSKRNEENSREKSFNVNEKVGKNDEERRERKRKPERCNDEFKMKEARRSWDRDSSGGNGKGHSFHKSSTNENEPSTSSGSTKEKQTGESPNQQNTTERKRKLVSEAEEEEPSDVDKILMKINSSIEESENIMPKNEQSIKKPKIAKNIFEIKKIMQARKNLARQMRHDKKKKESLDFLQETHDVSDSPSTTQSTPSQDTTKIQEENKENIKTGQLDKIKTTKVLPNTTKFTGFLESDIEKSRNSFHAFATRCFAYCQSIGMDAIPTHSTENIDFNKFCSFSEDLLDSNLNKLKPKSVSFQRRKTYPDDTQVSKAVENIMSGKNGCYVLLQDCTEAIEALKKVTKQEKHKPEVRVIKKQPSNSVVISSKQESNDSISTCSNHTEQKPIKVQEPNIICNPSHKQSCKQHEAPLKKNNTITSGRPSTIKQQQKQGQQEDEPSSPDAAISVVLNPFLQDNTDLPPSVPLTEAMLDNLMMDSSIIVEEECLEETDDSDYEYVNQCQSGVKKLEENKESFNENELKKCITSSSIKHESSEKVVILCDSVMELPKNKGATDVTGGKGSHSNGSEDKSLKRRNQRASQRYDNTDLYKPRPVLPQNANRVRTPRSVSLDELSARGQCENLTRKKKAR